MNQGDKAVSYEALVNLLSKSPIVVHDVAELAFLNVPVNSIILRVRYNVDNGESGIFNGYRVYIVSDSENKSEIGRDNGETIPMTNGLFAHEIPPFGLNVTHLSSDGFNIVSSQLLSKILKSYISSNNIINDLKKGGQDKVHNAECTKILNTKIQSVIDFIRDYKIVIKDGVVVDDDTSLKQKILVQLEFNVGETEKIIPRNIHSALSSTSVDRLKCVTAYLTSIPSDDIYPNLVAVVEDDSIIVKPIVDNLPYTVPQPFTCNVDILYERDNQDK